ncbi:ATP-binding protein [Peribacillus frigoritolerans]|uniref:ATP-binding protein n=1 Tax=Peribacillus frigoritolerans TaxID=450367 RepID=UPI0021D109B9|nr:ATP-binding protein [Peribacillus frigoritolerans]MCU6599004.1 ATP-binding protein [Peribacillus frigoritolerans]
MIIDYIVNLSIYTLFVSIPLVIPSFINHKRVKNFRLWLGVYAGLFFFILVFLSFKQQGYSYDLRFAPIILVFAYLGPMAGLITGLFSLLARLYISGDWYPIIIGWGIIMICYSAMHKYSTRLTPIKKIVHLFGAYIVIYVSMVSVYDILRDNPYHHLQNLLLVMVGIIIGVVLIESYVKLHRLNGKLLKMYKKIEESESKYRLIAENTSDLIVVINNENSICYFSPSHKFVLGYEESVLEGIELSTLIHPEDVCRFIETLNGMYENIQSQSIEFRFQHIKGHWIELESRCMPVKGENHSIEHIVMISRDISERKKSEEILLQSEKLSIVGELAAGVAHEIRNPLTTIKGFVQISREEKKFDFHDLLLSELERIETITTELLSLGKPQAIQLNRMNLRELIENTLELLTPQFNMNDIHFTLSVEESPIFITCEKNQLKQVFLNVLKNAIEAMNKGGEIHINLKKASDGACIISFQDQGRGIPEELLPRLGEPFYTLKEKGTGLGLMICHKIIKQHDGSIFYHSKVNEGTLVEITLPLAC